MTCLRFGPSGSLAALMFLGWPSHGPSADRREPTPGSLYEKVTPNILGAVVRDDRALLILMRGIAAGDAAAVAQSLAASPALASSSLRQGATRQSARDFFVHEIAHYLFEGDTPLHIAAAAHRKTIVSDLLSMGADVRARNRRGAQPLHYAADGMPGSGHLDPNAQRETVIALLEAGADPNATDNGGVTPLHRAVRNRCSSAVRALIDGGADVNRPNGSGSTPIQLAHWTTGRGGSGSPSAKAERKVIVQLLLEHGAR